MTAPRPARPRPPRRARALAGVLALAALATAGAGCTRQETDLASGPVDLARAERAWADPWLAPADAAVPTYVYGTNGSVERSVGSRTTTYDGSPAAAVAREVGAAVDGGWTLLTADCRPTRVVAQVARGDGLDDQVLATVTAEPAGGDAAPTATTTVDGVVPHHADGSWPLPAPAARTCLDGGSAGAGVPVADLVAPPEEPLPGDAAQDGPADVGWERDEPDADDRALLEDLAADPWAAAVGAEVRLPTLRTGDNDRAVTPARGTVADDLAGVVDDMVGGTGAWEPTWAACGGGAVDARLRLVTDHGTAVARLVQDAATGRRTAWEVTVPVPEGPAADPDVPALGSSRCLDAPPPADGLRVEGTPVAVPADLQPVGD